jgi:hypothetical protein
LFQDWSCHWILVKYWGVTALSLTYGQYIPVRHSSAIEVALTYSATNPPIGYCQLLRRNRPITNTQQVYIMPVRHSSATVVALTGLTKLEDQ